MTSPTIPQKVADLDQVLAANLVNLRISEAEKARLAREAAKELKVERGEEVWGLG